MTDNMENKNKYDYISYERALERVLEQAAKDYWVQLVDINRHQVGVAKTYLWVSAALLGAYFTSAGALARYSLLPKESCSYLFLFIAGISCILAFGICLYSLPGRGGYKLVTSSWQNYAVKAFSQFEAESQSIYRACLTKMIEDFDEAVGHGVRTNSTRAHRLRITSWLLITSFSSALIGVIFVLFENFINIGG